MGDVLNTAIKIFCGKMNVNYSSWGLMRTSEVQDPPARWETTGPEGEPLSGLITFPATYVRAQSLIEWWVDECQAIGTDGQKYPEVQIVSNLSKERCDFVLRCPVCGFLTDAKDSKQFHYEAICNYRGRLLPHVIARTILAPTTIQVPGYVGEGWQPVQSPFSSTGRWETDVASKPNPFAGQQGIVYPDVNAYFSGIGQMTVDACVATGEVRWSKP